MAYQLRDDPAVICLGHVAVFFVPIAKMHRHDVIDWLDHELIERYQGITKMEGMIEGSYRQGLELVMDRHLRYEVSFLGSEKVSEFIELMKELCSRIKEESIYLTMGAKSYLIAPKGS